LLVLRVPDVVQVVHAECFETREHTVSGRTRFAERRMAQLLVERLRQLRAKADTTVPDGFDLAQIKLTFFIRKRETLVTRPVVSRETHFGRIAIGVKANRVAAFARDSLTHSRDALVIVAVCDDENRHNYSSSAAAIASEIGRPRSRSSMPHSPPG